MRRFPEHASGEDHDFMPGPIPTWEERATPHQLETLARVDAVLESLRNAPKDDPYKLDRLELEIEGLGWKAHWLEKEGEAERAANLRAVQAAKHSEYVSLIAERRKA